MVFRICISDPKSRKTYQIEKEAPSLIGVRVGQKFDGGMIGLDGFTMELRGGSDKEGFPMRPEMDGSHRKKLLLTGGSGFNPKKKGLRRRKFVRGNQISEDIMQVNCKIVEGEGDVEMMLGIKKEEPKEGEASEAKSEEKKE
jgi:small subunit ribosomal protein S6e